MSQENVEKFMRGVEAYNRRDADALIEEMDPAIEWHPAILKELGGSATVYRGHEGVCELLREMDEALVEFHAVFSEVRDLGDRIVAIGHLRIRGKTSGVPTESRVGYIADFANGKLTRARTYLDPREALEAAGLPE